MRNLKEEKITKGKRGIHVKQSFVDDPDNTDE